MYRLLPWCILVCCRRWMEIVAGHLHLEVWPRLGEVTSCERGERRKGEERKAVVSRCDGVDVGVMREISMEVWRRDRVYLRRKREMRPREWIITTMIRRRQR